MHMEFIMQVLFDTEWGAIIVGALILIAVLIEIFYKKPKI
jgi:ABC-type xylose transport system permease subunit